jgi:hypothetical protein
MTKFQEDVTLFKNGPVPMPKMVIDGLEIDYFLSLISSDLHALRQMAKGLKVRYLIYSQIRRYYNLSAKNAADAVAELETIMAEYKANL